MSCYLFIRTHILRPTYRYDTFMNCFFQGQQFVTHDGKTYMIEDEELVLFGDFMLKLLGEIKSPQTVDQDQSAGAINEEGYWLASCGVITAKEYRTGMIIAK